MDTFFPGISVNILLLQTSAHLSLLGCLRAQTGLVTALLAAHCFVANRDQVLLFLLLVTVTGLRYVVTVTGLRYVGFHLSRFSYSH